MPSYRTIELFDDRSKHLDHSIRNFTHKGKYRFFLVEGKRIEAI